MIPKARAGGWAGGCNLHEMIYIERYTHKGNCLNHSWIKRQNLHFLENENFILEQGVHSPHLKNFLLKLVVQHLGASAPVTKRDSPLQQLFSTFLLPLVYSFIYSFFLCFINLFILLCSQSLNYSHIFIYPLTLFISLIHSFSHVLPFYL